jgi:hypothetical protein
MEKRGVKITNKLKREVTVNEGRERGLNLQLHKLLKIVVLRSLTIGTRLK